VKINNIKSPSTHKQFPCSQCGSILKYQPNTQQQVCSHCGQTNHISTKQERIEEYDLAQTLRELAQAQPSKVSDQAHCKACGANFKFSASVHANECPFCGTDIVISPQQSKPLPPKSLLPFLIEEAHAKKQFRLWLNKLWFAPNEVKKYARADTKLTGIYLPYWTYDSHTDSTYTGARGDTYYVKESVSDIQNGRQVTTVKRVPKIRWSNVRGRVSRFFDDVLIGASLSLPRQILDRLLPWDLENLVPYDENYISGFQSELYQVNLDEGFDRAKQVMDGMIHQDIAHDIGGDHQRIHQVNTQHNQVTYKHCLLPVWSAAFMYRDKAYRFVINGRTGEVQGERPYSVWKIGFAVIVVLGLIGGLVYLQQTGALNQVEYSSYSGNYQLN